MSSEYPGTVITYTDQDVHESQDYVSETTVTSCAETSPESDEYFTKWARLERYRHWLESPPEDFYSELPLDELAVKVAYKPDTVRKKLGDWNISRYHKGRKLFGVPREFVAAYVREVDGLSDQNYSTVSAKAVWQDGESKGNGTLKEFGARQFDLTALEHHIEEISKQRIMSFFEEATARRIAAIESDENELRAIFEEWMSTQNARIGQPNSLDRRIE